jgi:hypothetical protein
MGDKTEAFDISQTPLSSHYPLPLKGARMLLSPMLRHLHSSENTGRMMPATNRKEKLGGGKAGSSFSTCLLVDEAVLTEATAICGLL